MKFSIAAGVALTLAAGVTAQLEGFPDCALSCLAGGLSKTGCGIDIGCACKKEEFVNTAVACVQGKCNAEDTAAATKGAVALCKQYGVDIKIPGGEEPTTSSTSTPATTSTPTSTSSTPTSTTTTTTAAPEETEEPEPTTTPLPTTTAPVVPPTTNGTNGTTPITPPTNEDSAAGKVAVSGLFAAGLGLAVAFGL